MIKQIIESFRRIEQVERIEVTKQSDKSFHFLVLTSNTKYNKQLMVDLLNTEYEIEEKFKDIYLTFEYLPIFIKDGE